MVFFATMVLKIGSKIKELRLSQHLTQAQFARLCGWKEGHARVSHYERGIRQPKHSDIEKISKTFNIESKWFYTEENNLAAPRILYIPIIPWDQVDKWPYEKSRNLGITVESADKISDNAFALSVNNPSMLPTFPLGSTIIIDPNKEIKNNDYVIALVEGKQATFKKFWNDSGNKLLISDNTAFPSIPISEKTKFIGPVIKMKIDFQKEDE